MHQDSPSAPHTLGSLDIRCCIFNVDDLGLSRGVNEGVVETHLAGLVHSASLMVEGPAIDHAITLAQGHSGLSVGLHTQLTDEDGAERVALDDPGLVAAELDRQLHPF